MCVLLFIAVDKPNEQKAAVAVASGSPKQGNQTSWRQMRTNTKEYRTKKNKKKKQKKNNNPPSFPKTQISYVSHAKNKNHRNYMYLYKVCYVT